MASYFGVRAYRVNVPLANTPIPIWTPAIGAAGYQRFSEAITITSLSTNTSDMAVGGSNVTVGTALTTDGPPLSPGDFRSYGVDPKVSSLSSELDLSLIYIVAATAGDDFFVEYISKE